jgi:Zn-dependent protease
MNYPRLGTYELVELLIAFVVLTIAFAFVFGGMNGIKSSDLIFSAALGVGTGFLLHELAHKFVAQRYGYWAEFKLSTMGLILTVIMAISPFHMFVGLPGAVMFGKGGNSPPQSTYSPDEDAYWDTIERKVGNAELWIALAGPLTNLILAALFFSLLQTDLLGNGTIYGAVYFALRINLILGAFNMIPIDPFDGGKVFRANRLIWIIVGVPMIFAALAVYAGIF